MQKKKMVDLKRGDILDDNDGSTVFFAREDAKDFGDGQVIVRIEALIAPNIRGNFVGDADAIVNVRD